MLKCPHCNSSRWNGKICKRCGFENSQTKESYIQRSAGEFQEMEINKNEDLDEILYGANC